MDIVHQDVGVAGEVIGEPCELQHEAEAEADGVVFVFCGHRFQHRAAFKADAGRFKAQFADIIVVDAEIPLQQARHLRRGGKAGVLFAHPLDVLRRIVVAVAVGDHDQVRVVGVVRHLIWVYIHYGVVGFKANASVLYKPDRFKGVHSTTPYCFDVYFLWLHRILTVFQTQRRHEGKNTAFFIVTPPAPKVKTGGMQMKPQKIKYAPLFAAMLLCVALAGCGGAPHESGEGRFSQSETQDGTRAAPRADAVRAAAGGDIALPATLAAPQTDSTINTLLDAGVLSGAFTTVNSCRTRDLCTAGEITVRVRAELDAQTSRKDAKFALWKLADGRAEYLETVYFTCDSTVQSYTFTGLAAGARYRVVFSYTESGARRMSGAFNVEGVTAEIEEETQEEGAVAAGAQPGS